MSANLGPFPKFRAFTHTGTFGPLVGGKLYSYVAGSSTPLATYTTVAGNVANANPVVLDANGEASVYFLSQSYKLVLTDANDVVQWTVDNFETPYAYTDSLRSDLSNTSDTNKGDALIGVDRTAAGAVATTLHAYIEGQIFNAKTDFGAVGDGVTDDFAALQTALDTLGNLGGGTLYLPSGTYKIDGANLVIWGSNIIVRGAGRDATILKKFNGAGYWGDAFDVTGKLSGAHYYGMTNGTTFGGGDYTQHTAYTGTSSQGSNVTVTDLTVDNDSSVVSTSANSLGVVNSDRLVVERCNFKNAPQTNVACVNDTTSSLNGHIVFVDCLITGAKMHQARVNSFNASSNVGNRVRFVRCVFTNAAGAEAHDSSIMGRYVHLFFRAGVESDLVSCSVESCIFDGTGTVCSTNNCKNFRMVDSTLETGMYFTGQASIPSKMIIRGNRFNCTVAKNGFTSEYFLYFVNVTDATITENHFNSTVTTGNTLAALMAFYSGQQIVFSKNINFSLAISTNVATSTDIVVTDNIFAKPSVSTTERGFTVSGTNILLASNVMANTMVYVAGNTTNLQVVNNKFTLTTNEGYDVVGGPGTQTNTKALGNEVIESGAFATSNRGILASYTGHIVDNNRITDPSGNIVGQGLFLAAAPSAGYSRVGDRHYKAAPTLNNVFFVCTVAGTPGTWVTQ